MIPHSLTLEVPLNDTLSRLKKNAQRRDELVRERDDLIFLAKTEGVPVTHIAEAIGLDRTQVHRILRDSWLVAEVGTGKIVGWYRSEEAAKAAAGNDGRYYQRNVEVADDGTWGI